MALTSVQAGTSTAATLAALPPPIVQRGLKRPLQDDTNSRNLPGDRTKGKGKGKHVQPTAEPWKSADHLLGHSYNLHRLSPMHSFILGSTTASFVEFAKQLKVYLAQQLALGGESDLNLGAGDPSLTRVEAGFVGAQLHGEEQPNRLPILIEVEHGGSGAASGSAESSSTSLFVLVPSSLSSHYPLLLTKSALPALTTLFLNYLATRHDTLITPFRLPSPSMLSLLESLVQQRDTSLDDGPIAAETLMHTSATFTFPSTIATEGLSSLTLTLPPPLLAALTSSPTTPFLAALTTHFQSITSLSLAQLSLVRAGAGRGTFLHSGQGGAEGAGGKLKFYKKAGEEGEMERVLSELVKVAEARGRVGAA